MRKIGISKVGVITNIIICTVLIAVAAVGFYPSQGAVSTFGEQPIYHGNEDSKKVSLMFNVYEGADTVRKIMEVLEANSVKATFFFGGCFADDNEKLLRDLVAGGYEIANHGYFHLDHSTLSLEKNIEEIQNTERIIYAFTGVKTTLFAPPSGAFGKNTLSAADSLGYRTILWTKDTIDWRDSDKQLIYKRATEKLSGGDLILMHPKPHTAEVLDSILKYYIECGFEQVTVSECLEV